MEVLENWSNKDRLQSEYAIFYYYVLEPPPSGGEINKAH